MQKEKKDKHFIKKPIYPGGIAAMRKFIRENMKYPKEALENMVEGTVKLKYTIDHQGKVIETKVIHGLGYGCDEEAERLARALRFDVPKNRKIRVTFHKDLQVHFKLPKKKAVSTQYQYEVTKGKKEGASSPAKGSFSYTFTIVNSKQ